MPKIADLWAEVEKTRLEKTPAGLKMAILEAHKVLEAVLESKGYVGKNIERKLFWAGYSLKDKEGLSEGLEKREKILSDFEYQLSDFEAEEIVRKYKKVIDEVASGPKFGYKERAKLILETYFSPKSFLFWQNLAIFLGFFFVINLLASTTFGIGLTKWLVEVAAFIISWRFLLLVAVIIGLGFAFSIYLAGRSKIKIKE